MGEGLPRFVLCADFGSTFTKVALVDTADRALLGTEQHPTTLDTDLVDGFVACRERLVAAHPQAADAVPLACSSAGGGLRIAVVGNEELVTAEAGRRVALSSGGKVVAVLAGGLDEARLDALTRAEPDVVLLVGGTDGGNAEQLRADAGRLAEVRWSGPVVVAGDRDSAEDVAGVLAAAGVAHEVAGNVVPRIGVLAPESARAALRAVFLRHVIGGKGLSSDPAFEAMLLGATPDVVLAGVEALAEAHGSRTPGSGVVVVDVGGATTDVYSALVADPEERELAREVVAGAPLNRTVEGDLGVHWSAETTVAAAAAAGLPVPDQDDAEQVAGAAITLAVRRHAGRSQVVLGPDGRVVERSGTDLRGADLLVGSGGVLRALARAEGVDRAGALLGGATGRHPDGWQLPEAPRVVVDQDYLLAPAGLLLLHGERLGSAAEAAEVARHLLCTSVIGTGPSGRSHQ